MILLDLFWRFVLISLVAFGGGQAALPLLERVAVAQRAWVTPAMFSTAVAFGYMTPGPVLIVATFVGFQAAGLPGAVVATVGAFLFPWLLAALAAGQIQRMGRSPILKAFGRGAAPAVVGLLGVTLLSLAGDALANAAHIGIASAAALLAVRTKLHPIWILAGGAIVGIIAST